MANAGYGFNTSKTVMVLTASEDANTMKYRFGSGTTLAGEDFSAFRAVGKYLEQITGGVRQGGALWLATGAVSSSGTFTIASGNLSAADTVTIAGTAFTAETSGATGNQFNIGATALATAQAVAAAVNASTTSAFIGMIVATAAAGTSSSGVVTFTAQIPGNTGNLISLAKSAANGTVSGALLTGGSQNVARNSSNGI